MGIRERLKLHKNEQYIPKPKGEKKKKGPYIPKGRTLTDEESDYLSKLRRDLENREKDLKDKENNLKRIEFETSVKLTEEIKNICDEYGINTNNRILEIVRNDAEIFLSHKLDFNNGQVQNTHDLYQKDDFLRNIFETAKEGQKIQKCIIMINKCVEEMFSTVGNEMLAPEFHYLKQTLLFTAGFFIFYCIAKIYNYREEYDEEDEEEEYL